MFRCADSLEASSPYYESIDFFDALHPQTILAYEMNGRPLPIAYGAPLRPRLERQLGYKMAKYIMRAEVAATVEFRTQGRARSAESAMKGLFPDSMPAFKRTQLGRIILAARSRNSLFKTDQAF